MDTIRTALLITGPMLHHSILKLDRHYFADDSQLNNNYTSSSSEPDATDKNIAVTYRLATSCDFNSVQTCDSYFEIADSALTLLDVDDIDAKCKRYADLFTCANKYLGDCDLKRRLSWQSLYNQINTLCARSKADYIATRTCWDDEETQELVEECNIDVQDSFNSFKMDVSQCLTGGRLDTPLKGCDFDPVCRTMDEFVTCTTEAVEEECSPEAVKVMHDMATSYVSLAKTALNCVGVGLSTAPPMNISSGSRVETPRQDNGAINTMNTTVETVTDTSATSRINPLTAGSGNPQFSFYSALYTIVVVFSVILNYFHRVFF